MNHELAKLAETTNDVNKLKDIIRQQQLNRESMMLIVSALLQKDHHQADYLAQKYLPSPK